MVTHLSPIITPSKAHSADTNSTLCLSHLNDSLPLTSLRRVNVGELKAVGLDTEEDIQLDWR